MKKHLLVFTILISMLSVINISQANANMEVVAGGALGPQVITNFNAGINNTPTVGGSSGGSFGGGGGSYGIVDSNNGVANIVVCHSFCANGTFGAGGDTVVSQIPNSDVGIWFGPNTTTYDRETKIFTATDPNSVEITATDENSSITISGNKVLTFVSGNIFVVNGKLIGVSEGWSLNSVATVSVTENNVLESLFLGNRKTSQEIQKLIDDSNLLLLSSKVQNLTSLLGSWVK